MAVRHIRKSRRWLSAQELGFLVFVLLVLAALFAANIGAARVLPGGEWFYLRWSGARAFLVEQVEPYSTEIAQRTQEVAYGRRAFSSEYGYVLNDPLFIVLLYTPLALLPEWISPFFPSATAVIDFTIIRALWMLLSQAALFGTVILAVSLSEWQPPRWLFVLLLGFGLLSYFSLNALVTGSPAVFLGLIYVAILAALRSQTDEIAGALLALAVYQWEAGGLFFLYILFLVIANRRWQVLAGLGMALFLLLAISFLADPGWWLPYLRAVLSDWYRGATLSFGPILFSWFPNVSLPLGNIVSIALAILLLAEWLGSAFAHFRRIVWTAALSLAVTPLMGFAIFPSNHVLLILPFCVILALVWERWQRRRVFFVLLLFILVLLIPFGLYARSIAEYDPLITDLMSVLPPMAATVGLYWMRWWVIRSPRTWFDRLGDYR